MKVICLFGQRVCSYDGQYGPELLAAMDEYGNDDNPDYLDKEEEKWNNNKDILFHRRITININDDKFNEVFFGKELDGNIETD